MVLFILLVFAIHRILNGAVDFSAPSKDQLNLILAVMERLQAEPAVVVYRQGLEDGGQSADRIVQCRLSLAGCAPLTAALQILTTDHSKVVLHVRPQKGLVKELAVPAAHILWGGVGDVLVPLLPFHVVSPRLHTADELLSVTAQLRRPLDVLPQFPFPDGDLIRVSLRFCDG